MAPNLENIAKWADALESGEYTQGRHKLHDITSNAWCCLGVACDVARKNGVDITVGQRASTVGVLGSHHPTMESFDGEHEYLPAKVQAWLGIGTNNPTLAGYCATERNDMHGETFPEIARLIRAEWLDGETG